MKWSLHFPPATPPSRLSGWPRVLWIMQVQLDLPNQIPKDIRFLLPVDAAGESSTLVALKPRSTEAEGMGCTVLNLGWLSQVRVLFSAELSWST